MCPTGSALHVIAAFGLLDSAPTPWAISRVVLLLPRCKSVVPEYGAFVLFACETFMADRSALGTDRGDTR